MHEGSLTADNTRAYPAGRVAELFLSLVTCVALAKKSHADSGPVQIACVAARAIGVHLEPQHVQAGGGVDAGLRDGRPRLPPAGVGDRQRAGDVDAVDLGVEFSVA